jgi:hypothetical protein
MHRHLQDQTTLDLEKESEHFLTIAIYHKKPPGEGFPDIAVWFVSDLMCEYLAKGRRERRESAHQQSVMILSYLIIQKSPTAARVK